MCLPADGSARRETSALRVVLRSVQWILLTGQEFAHEEAGAFEIEI